MKTTIKCLMCGKSYEIEVNDVDYQKFLNGEHVQNCFPYLSEEQRELFISQTCGICWDILFDESEL